MGPSSDQDKTNNGPTVSLAWVSTTASSENRTSSTESGIPISNSEHCTFNICLK